MIPGSNVLKMAFSVIAKQRVLYYQAIGRVLNNVGQNVTTYNPPCTMFGSFQPVPRRLYQAYGLDLQKDYFTFYTNHNLTDIARGVSADQIVFQGQRFQVESDNDWYAMDGWKGVLCIRVGVNTAATNLLGFGSSPPNTYTNFNDGNILGNGETFVQECPNCGGACGGCGCS